jgi:uncharacterized protein YbjT (DUF2867 family)
MNRVLVIGATGNVGREVTAQLLNLQKAGAEVRALTRNPGAAGLPRQAGVVRGDLTLPETLDGALDGIATVFLVWTAPASAVLPAIERIARRAQRIVFLTSPHKTLHPFFQQPNPLRELHAQIEEAIERSGLAWTFLRPGMFADNALAWWVPQIRAGNVVRWPRAAANTAPIDVRDIAAVGVCALCEEGHVGREYVLTGPQSLSQREQVEIIGQAIDRPLRLDEISPDEARRELLTIMPPPVINMLLDAWTAAIGQPAFVTSTVADVTRVPPRTFLDWAHTHAGQFQL